MAKNKAEPTKNVITKRPPTDISKLTDQGKPRGVKYGVEGVPNLLLHVRGKSKLWYFRYTSPTTGKERYMPLGPWSLVNGLTHAEMARNVNHLKVTQEKIDPQDERDQLREDAKDEAARLAMQPSYREFFNSLPGKLPKKAESRAAKIRYGLDILGEYADLKPHQITAQHLREVIEPRWLERGVVIESLKYISEYLRAARKLGVIKEPGWMNPASLSTMKMMISTPFPEATPRKALKLADLPDLLAKLRQGRNDGGSQLTFLIVELLILTALRSAEVTRMRWAWVDREAKLFRIPREAMKGDMTGVAAEVTHFEVPITPAMEAVLDRAAFLAPPQNDNDPVFPSATSKDGFFLDGTVLDVLETLGFRTADQKITIHGFRSVFVGWAQEQTRPVLDDDNKPVIIDGEPEEERRFDKRDIQMCLAHVEKDKTERVYDRFLPVKPRLPIMRRWSLFCGSREAAVVDLAAERESRVYGRALARKRGRRRP